MKRLREDLHRLRFVLPLTFVAVMLLRWAVFRGQPERLAELPLGPGSQWTGIVGDNVIVSWIAANGVDIESHARPVTGGRGRLLLRQNSAMTEAGAFTAGPYLYCVNVWYPPQAVEKARSAEFGSRVVGVDDGRMPLAARPMDPNHPRALGLLSPGNRGRFSPRSKSILSRVPLAGGVPQKITLDMGNPDPIFYNVAVAGNQIFWTKRTPISKEEAAKYKTTDDVTTLAFHELMATPLNGGPARRIYGGIFAAARVYSTDMGVYWRVVKPGKDRATDLIYVPSDTQKITVSADCAFEPSSPPVICKGKAYWINEQYSSASIGLGLSSPVRRDIISANLDGTSQRVAMNLMSGNSATLRLTRLFSYQDHLYGIGLDIRSDNGSETSHRTSLYRIDPDGEPVARLLTPLPRRAWDRGIFENGYYYFVVSELQDNLLDWSTDGASRPEKFYLYRWKLPAGNAL